MRIRKSVQPRSVRSAIVLLLSAHTIAGCTVWQNVPLTTGAKLATSDTVITGSSGAFGDDAGVRVHLGAQELRFRAIATHGDSVYGFRRDDSISIPAFDIRRLEVRKTSRGRTAVAGAIAFAAYLGAAAAFSDRRPGY
jgi:hypothetical protein